ncbi:hypothetical protein NKH72_24065 [Mesorhizobium sp. M0955]|uniref:hypothetical protein n=1 Tax=Mesorhizobium sp. M0955 TaxID=2957033 RepID=UPI00333813E8
MNQPAASPDKMTSITDLIQWSATRDHNEADTRHKVIDTVLHEFLAWPKNRVATEEYIRPGFADYILKKANGDDLIFIEAKKDGVFFELPDAATAGEVSSYISIQKLLSDPNINDAMGQVRRYCFDTGCEYACITNGIQWVLFKTFEKAKRWETLSAFVVRDLTFFAKEYTRAVNALSFKAITENSSLVSLLTSAPPKDRQLYFPKDDIPAYSHTITANRLASTLRPIINHYFGIIGDDDTEFMERCYVSQRDSQASYDGMRTLIHDSLSPYFQSYGVQQLDETGKGGQLGGRLTKNIKKGRKGEVLVLFGGKGSGKSTFIKRLLHHNPPRWLKDHSVVAIVDLLKIPEDIEGIRVAIWDILVRSLDVDRILESDRSTLIAKLFSDRFQTASKQELSGLPKASEAYNLRLNNLISEWKLDKTYCARQLVDYWKDRAKGIIVVVDNTDQYAGPTQDFCFASAQQIADELGCVTLISMREERFYNSKIHGVLDAFQNAGFHISSPKPAEVFKKRLAYTVGLLENEARRSDFIHGADKATVDDCCKYLNILCREFMGTASPLNSFLTACAHGDIRLSLDLFRSFLLSGYTNVEETLAAGTWNFLIHQVIKPVMIPTRYFYDEGLSDIPNIYQIRYARHGSHFTGLRILRKLSKNIDGSAPAYMSVSELKSYFAETFNMLDDFVKNADILLKHGFVESNNRVDAYSDEVDSIKITNYGLYMYEELAYDFTYLDLICTDSAVFNETVNNYLAEAARREYGLFIKGDRLERVKVRLHRVGEYITYLRSEEDRERSLYSLGMPETEMFAHKSHQTFQAAKTRVLASAKRQSDIRGRRPRAGR